MKKVRLTEQEKARLTEQARKARRATLHRRVVVYFRELQLKEAETVAERDAHHAAQADLRKRVLQHFQELQFREAALAAYRRTCADICDTAAFA